MGSCSVSNGSPDVGALWGCDFIYGLWSLSHIINNHNDTEQRFSEIVIQSLCLSYWHGEWLIGDGRHINNDDTTESVSESNTIVLVEEIIMSFSSLLISRYCAPPYLCRQSSTLMLFLSIVIGKKVSLSLCL